MSRSFRPVRHEWGTSSSCFIDSDEVVAVLEELAEMAGSASEGGTVDDMLIVWIEDGKAFFDYVEAMDVDELLPEMIRVPDGSDEDRTAAACLVGNIKNLASEWRRSIGRHGELVFYID